MFSSVFLSSTLLWNLVSFVSQKQRSPSPLEKWALTDRHLHSNCRSDWLAFYQLHFSPSTHFRASLLFLRDTLPSSLSPSWVDKLQSCLFLQFWCGSEQFFVCNYQIQSQNRLCSNTLVCIYGLSRTIKGKVKPSCRLYLTWIQHLPLFQRSTRPPPPDASRFCFSNSFCNYATRPSS